MSASILTPECGGGESLDLGPLGRVRPPVDHAACPVSQTTPGVLGGWVCRCGCHRSLPESEDTR